MDEQNLARAIHEAMPLTVGEASLVCRGMETLDGAVSLVLAVEVRRDGVLDSMTEQSIPVATLDVASPAELVERALERLAAIDEYPPTPSQLLAPPFRSLDARALEDADAWTVYDRLVEQAHGAGFDLRFDRLATWPDAPRRLYYLVLAQGQLGGRGLEVFLAQAPFEEVTGILDALDAAGCPRLAERLRQGITLCGAEGGSELELMVDPEWFEEVGLPVPEGEGRAWSRLDSWDPGGTWWLVREELEPAIAQYLEAHRGALTGR